MSTPRTIIIDKQISGRAVTVYQFLVYCLVWQGISATLLRAPFHAKRSRACFRYASLQSIDRSQRLVWPCIKQYTLYLYSNRTYMYIIRSVTCAHIRAYINVTKSGETRTERCRERERKREKMYPSNQLDPGSCPSLVSTIRSFVVLLNDTFPIFYEPLATTKFHFHLSFFFFFNFLFFYWFLLISHFRRPFISLIFFVAGHCRSRPAVVSANQSIRPIIQTLPEAIPRE